MSQLGPYKLLRRLATGGMGEIFLANLEREAGFEKVVVIKKILPSLSDDPAFVQMFNREARIAAKLGHQNIVQIFDFGQADGVSFIAMEYIHGRDLKTLIEASVGCGEELEPSIAAAIVTAIASGLDYAHRRTGPEGNNLGIVHRDVSPQNVLISYEGGVKLTDFGLAVSRDAQESAGQVQGKFAYMSPEQTIGADLDRRSDVFSLGIVAYELFCGHRPFSGESMTELIGKIRGAEFVPATERVPSLPQSLDTLFSRALARHPQDRYQQVGDLLEDLAGMCRDQGWAATSSEIASWAASVCPAEVASSAESVPEGTVVSARPIASPGEAGVGAYDQTLPAESPVRTSTTAPAMAAISRSTQAAREVPPTPREPTKLRARAPWILLFVVVSVAAIVWTVVSLGDQTPDKEVPSASGRDAAAGELDAEAAASHAPVDNIVVEVVPIGAQVTIDGRTIESADGRFVASHAPGTVTIEVSAAGYHKRTLRLEVGAEGKIDERVRLLPRPIAVHVRAPGGVRAAVVVTGQGGFETKCFVPCEVSVPSPGQVEVHATIEGTPTVWSQTQTAVVGGELTFSVPAPVATPASVREPSLKAWLKADTAGGKRQSVGLISARLATRPTGSNHKTVAGLGVTLRYQYEPASDKLTINLSCNPWCAIAHNGRAVSAPLAKYRLAPGNHRFVLGSGKAEVAVSYKGR